MAKKIGDMFVQLKLDNKHFKENLNQSLKQSKVTSRGMMMAFGVVTLALGGVSTALGKVTKDLMRYGLEVDKSSKIMELNVIQTQKLRYAAEQEHTSLQAVEKGIMNLNIRLGYAGDKMASYIRYFDALNIAYRKTDGTLRNAYDVFGDLFDVMEGGNVTTEETAAVMQLVGARAAKELIPMLKKGKEWFQKMGDEADRLGIILDEDTIRLIKETDDSITAMKASFRGLSYLLGKTVVPYLKDFADVLTRITRQVNKITEAGTLAEKAYRILSMVFPQFITPIEEARIEFVVKQMEQLKEEGKENTVAYQMLGEELKFLWMEFDGMAGVSIPNLNEGLKDVRKTTRETNKEIKEQIDLWKQWITMDTGKNLEEINEAFEQSAIDLSGLTEQFEDADDATKDWSEQTRALGNILGKVLTKGKMDAEGLLKSLLAIGISFLPGGGFLKGLLGGIFGMGEGGITVPKGTAPVFGMQEGGVVATKPTVSSGGVPFGEKGWEVFMKGHQWTEFIKSMKPTILIHNYTNRDIIVEEIKGTSESAKFELQRELSDNVLSKTEMLNE